MRTRVERAPSLSNALSICLLIGSIQSIAMCSSAITVYNDHHQDASIMSKTVYGLLIAFLVLSILGVVLACLELTGHLEFDTNILMVITVIWLVVTIASSILTHNTFNNAKVHNGSAYMNQPVGFIISYVVVAIVALLAGLSYLDVYNFVNVYS